MAGERAGGAKESKAMESLNVYDWNLELVMAARAFYATALGVLVGLERQMHGREAGMRTYGAVALGACVFALVSSHIPGAEPSRIAANIVTGVGFLGAGVILRTEGRTVGLTTAATLWAVAAVGTAVAFGMYVLATLAALLTLFLLAAHHISPFHRRGNHDENKA